MIRILGTSPKAGLCHGLRAVGCDKPAERTDHDAFLLGTDHASARGGRGLSFPWLTALLPGEACLEATYASAVGGADTLDIEDGLVVLDQRARVASATSRSSWKAGPATCRSCPVAK